MAESNVEVVRQFYDAINARAEPDWDRIFSPDWAAMPVMAESPDQVAAYRAVIGDFRSGAPDLAVDETEIIANGEVVAVRSRVSGTHTGALFGRAATGRRFEFSAMDIHRVVDGHITESWHVEDFARLMTQLGEDPDRRHDSHLSPDPTEAARPTDRQDPA